MGSSSLLQYMQPFVRRGGSSPALPSRTALSIAAPDGGPCASSLAEMEGLSSANTSGLGDAPRILPNYRSGVSRKRSVISTPGLPFPALVS